MDAEQIYNVLTKRNFEDFYKGPFIEHITEMDHMNNPMPQPGDEVKFFPSSGYGGHLAHCIVDKVNKKTFNCTERKGSYNDGRPWNVSVRSAYAINGVWYERVYNEKG